MSHRHGGAKIFLGDRFALVCQFLGSLNNVPASAVIETDIQNQARVGSSGAFRAFNTSHQLFRQAKSIANKMQLNTIGVKSRNLSAQCHGEQGHQAGDFFHRPIPVLRRKGKHGQHTNIPLSAGLDAATQ